MWAAWSVALDWRDTFARRRFRCYAARLDGMGSKSNGIGGAYA